MIKILAISALFFIHSSYASIKTYFNHNTRNSYYEPYRNIQRAGDNLEQVIIDQIRDAKKSIYIAVQELRLPLVALALAEKKREGVDVRVVLEHDYNYSVLSQRDVSFDNEHESSRLNDLKAFVDLNENGEFESDELETRDAIYILKKAGIPLLDDTSDLSEGSALMHHKFMVIDEKVTVVSTANFTLSCIHGDILEPRSRGNANSLVLVSSTSFSALFVEEFRQLWGNGRRGNFGLNKTYRGPRTVVVRGTKLTVQFSPTSKRFDWSESVNGLIGYYLQGARNSVKAALFVFSDQKLANILESASQRGASIGALIEPKFAYRYYSELLDMMGIQMRNPNCSFESDNKPWIYPIQEAGIPRLNTGDVLHHKFAVIDEETVLVGSQNWSDAANFLNDETLLVVENSDVAGNYLNEYERLKQKALLGIPERVISEIKELDVSCRQEAIQL
jgi:phosphatidylserine/phosphatidylglycerophosphate/cardiolipin synthase-like enzyme